MSKLLLVGEPLIRVSPNQFQPLTNACDAQLFFGGSEVNIARTLGGFGLEARLFTALPDNPVGHAFHQFFEAKRRGYVLDGLAGQPCWVVLP